MSDDPAAFDRVEVAMSENYAEEEAAAVRGWRPAILCDSEPVRFHRWHEAQHCHAGDGSMIYTSTEALVEHADGTMSSEFAHHIRFTDRTEQPR